jgi:acyl transferase domain-containing protein/NAD(P)H-dependent flavin oxidoreductase YrpB (nitropropane dioxygenase family)
MIESGPRNRRPWTRRSFMFKVSIVTPANLSHPGLAIAGARAGASIFFDIGLCRESHLPQVKINLSKTLKCIPESAIVGLRFHPEQAAYCLSLLEELSTRSHTLLLAGWDVSSAAKTAASLPPYDRRDWYLEVTDISQIESLDQAGVCLAGVVAKGHECGGWISESSSFILVQQLLAKSTHPVHVQGGIGPNTAAACRAAGAAGVVLDDQLWVMPESPFPQEWKDTLKNLNGSETIVCGERLGRPLRVLSRPGFTAAEKLRRLSEEAEMEDNAQRWQENAQSLIGWSDPSLAAWPVGQMVGMAASFAKRHRTTGRLVRAVREEAESSVRRAAALESLAPEAPLARSHGTRYPIVQGPMTRVSDVAPFAYAVAKAGGLPMLALALMRGPQVKELLGECKDLMGGFSWGIGILGFVPPDLREEQLAVVREVRPPFAIIAGGRAEHAAELESEGIATYLHVPTPQLLELFIGRGSRRFIFEGRECGGHVGPLSSFCLWESMIEKLLEVPEKAAREVHILFAGGIHDGRTGAMISALATPLAARGMKIGVLMGTAYLFTNEAVDCGAIVHRFQEEALKCTRTINLETGPGHASRCVVTPFAKEFYEARRDLNLKKMERQEISRTLDSLTLGRLRVASKGLMRKGDDLINVKEPEQFKQGMYMIGQAATVRESLVTLEELHGDVSEGSVRILGEASRDGEPEATSASPSDIAIVGMSALLPGAHDLGRYWSNLLQKLNTLQEIPAHRWDWRLYFDAEKACADKIYSKWGGFLEELPFDPTEFGIPPSAAKFIEPMQLLALEAVRRALTDAGCEDGNFDRENTSVIFGASGGLGDLGQLYATRSELPRVVGAMDDQVRNRLPEWSGDSFPGILLNAIAGRIANRFDLGGANYVIDAACASSLASLESAARELESGQCNVAIAGGVDTMQSPFGYFCFSRTQALSSRGEVRSFDEGADGIVISEGVGVLVMKRLVDAEREGDRIYAVIKGFGSSSDGRGASMTVPTSSGQIRALRRAYKKAGFSPATIGLYEAHGTGTPLGDRVELESLSLLLRESGAPPKSCAVGSVKTLIGHTKGAAGVSGMIKAVLALHYKVLPPHAWVENPLPLLRDASSPVYMRKEPAPWIRHPSQPRRAAVSAFGFGGTNFHAVLEEYTGAVKPSALGSENWPCELFAWKSPDRESLLAELTEFQCKTLSGDKSLRELACSLAVEKPGQGPAALCLTAASQKELAGALEAAIGILQERRTANSPNIQLRIAETKGGAPAKVAFLFPGQGSQYPDAAAETALYFQEIGDALAQADLYLDGQFPKRLAQYLYPPAIFTQEQRKLAAEELTQTRVAQPVIGALSCGFLDVLSRLGVVPDFLGGHSYGEYTALHAAGVFSREEFSRLSAIRGKAMQSACEGASGGMAAVAGSREDVARRIAGTPIVVANHNAPRETVISGPMDALEKILADLKKDGLPSKLLPVAGAFHSSLMQEAQRPLVEAIATVTFHRPQCSVFSNSHARPYAFDPESIRRQLESHMLSPVEFVGEIEAMYESGARIFIEVGPRNILSSLVAEILKDRGDAIIVALDPQRGTLRGFLNALGRLYADGLPINLKAIFAARQEKDLSAAHSQPRNRDWLLSGGGIRKSHESAGLSGKDPLLTFASLQEGTRPAPAAPSRFNNQQTEIMTSLKEPLSEPPKPPQNSGGAGCRPYETALHAYADYQETMRQFLKVQEEIMKQFLARGTSGVAPATFVKEIAAAPTEFQPAPAENGSSVLIPSVVNGSSESHKKPVETAVPDAGAARYGREDLTKILLGLVSERTGYPTEMLGLDQDLEADLGIDSIKRVEIVGAFHNQLPPILVQKLTEKNQDLSRVRTLNGWVDVLMPPTDVTLSR